MGVAVSVGVGAGSIRGLLEAKGPNSLLVLGGASNSAWVDDVLQVLMHHAGKPREAAWGLKRGQNCRLGLLEREYMASEVQVEPAGQVMQL